MSQSASGLKVAVQDERWWKKPVRNFFFILIVILAAGSIAELFLMGFNQVTDLEAKNELIGKMAEIQLVLYIAFLALLPQAKDIRHSLNEHPRLAIVLLLGVTLAIAAPVFAALGGFTSNNLEIVTKGVLGALILANATLVLDAIRDASDSLTAEEIAQALTAEIKASSVAIGASQSRSKKTWRIKVRGFGINIEEV